MKAPSGKDAKKPRTVSSLMIHVDGASKAVLCQAAALRGIGVSDYVREVSVAQARREVQAARAQTLALTAEEQLAFWNPLSESPRLTEGQRRLGAIMRGET
jgi:uncharacterized protein (DUF1778 family)